MAAGVSSPANDTTVHADREHPAQDPAAAAPGEARIRALVGFVVAGQRYGLDLALVDRVLPMVAVTRLPGAPAVVAGAINLHGRALAVVDLRRRLGLPAHVYGPSARLLVTATRDGAVAVAADEVLGVLELPAPAVVAPRTLLPELRRPAGIATLPDGLLLVHDLESLLTGDEELQLAAALDGGRG